MRPCIEPACHRLARGGPRGARCRGCQRRYDHARNHQPQRMGYQDPTYRAAVKYGLCTLRIPGICTIIATTRDHIVPISLLGARPPI